MTSTLPVSVLELELERYARQTAADCDCSRATALRHMLDEPAEVARDIGGGVSGDDVTTWAAAQLPRPTAAPSDRLYVCAPATPGATPSVVAEAATLDSARAAARGFAADRPDLRGMDVRIELPSGVLVEYAGTGR